MFLIRAMTGIGGLIILTVIIFIGGWIFNITVLLLALMALFEMYSAFQKKGFKPIIWLGFLITIIIFIMMLFEHEGFGWISILLLILLGLSIPVVVPKVRLVDSLLTIFGSVYPGLALLTMIPLLVNTTPYNQHLLTVTFFASWSTDAFAYVVGTLIGKTKLSPKISPQKTIEGSVGGVIGSIFVGVLVALVLNHTNSASLDMHHIVIISLICGIVSQIGDLVASSFKRFCKIKDFGNILPGHGGILDRFDSVLFTVPMVYAYYLVFLTS